MIQMNLQNRKRLTALENELLVAGGRMRGRVVWDGHVYIAVLKWKNK